MTWDARWQMNTCPECTQTFRVTPSDDVFRPACGCYDDAPDGEWLCEPCGLRHVYGCPHGPCADTPEPPKKHAVVVVDGDGHVLAQAEGDYASALIEEFALPDPGPDAEGERG